MGPLTHSPPPPHPLPPLSTQIPTAMPLHAPSHAPDNPSSPRPLTSKHRPSKTPLTCNPCGKVKGITRGSRTKISSPPSSVGRFKLRYPSNCHRKAGSDEVSWGFGITIIPKAHGSPVGHPRLQRVQREGKGFGRWPQAPCPKLSVLQPGSGWLLSAVVRSTQAEGWRETRVCGDLGPVIVDLPPAQRGTALQCEDFG